MPFIFLTLSKECFTLLARLGYRLRDSVPGMAAGHSRSGLVHEQWALGDVLLRLSQRLIRLWRKILNVFDPPSPRLRRDFSEVRLRSLSFDGISPKLNAKAVQRRWTLAKENFGELLYEAPSASGGWSEVE